MAIILDERFRRALCELPFMPDRLVQSIDIQFRADTDHLAIARMEILLEGEDLEQLLTIIHGSAVKLPAIPTAESTTPSPVDEWKHHKL